MTYVENMPGIETEFGVIAGGVSDVKGYNPWIVGDDDGVVSVGETHLQGERDFLIINALHSTLLNSRCYISAFFMALFIIFTLVQYRV